MIPPGRHVYDRTTLRASERVEGASDRGTPPPCASQKANCAALSEIRLIGKVIAGVIAMLLMLLAALFAPPLLGDWLIVTRTKEIEGGNAIDCGRVDPTQDASPHVACAKRALSERRPFRIVVDRRGIDSNVADGLVLDTNGTSHLLAYDSAPCGNFLCLPSRREQKCVGAAIDVSPSPFGTGTLVTKISFQGS